MITYGFSYSNPIITFVLFQRNNEITFMLFGCVGSGAGRAAPASRPDGGRGGL
jgi:hypothetical protein